VGGSSAADLPRVIAELSAKIVATVDAKRDRKKTNRRLTAPVGSNLRSMPKKRYEL
jgi:hypothetical protein